VDGVGLSLVAISTEELSVPTIVIPSCADFDNFMQLAAGWNLLVEVGLMNQVDMDKPARARKIGNESLLSSIAAL
jgi:glucosamine--fructose-6-phosphate aminotransferase (isomerizing)